MDESVWTARRRTLITTEEWELQTSTSTDAVMNCAAPRRWIFSFGCKRLMRLGIMDPENWTRNGTDLSYT